MGGGGGGEGGGGGREGGALRHHGEGHTTPTYVPWDMILIANADPITSCVGGRGRGYELLPNNRLCHPSLECRLRQWPVP